MATIYELEKRITRLERNCCCGGADGTVEGGCCFTELTLAGAQTLVTGSQLIAGSMYKITGVHKNKLSETIQVLYDDGNNAGVDIYLTAISANEFSAEGWGEFWNPIYDQTNYGAAVDGGSYMYNIWDGDNPDVTLIPTYAIGQKVIWGGYVWENVAGAVGTATNYTTLDADWTKVAYNTTDYNLVIDYIEYDLANDWIIRRKNAESNIDVIFPFESWNPGLYYSSIVSLHAISVAQWGNPYNSGTNLGSGDVTVNNSYVEFANFKGLIFNEVLYTGLSLRFNGYFGINSSTYRISLRDYCSQNGVKLNRGGVQKNFSFTNGCNQGSLLGTYVLLIDNNSSQYDFSFINDCYQTGNITLDNGGHQAVFSFLNECGQGQDGTSILIDNNGYQDDVSFINYSTQDSFTIDNGGNQQQLSLTNFAYQGGFILDGASQLKLHLESLGITYVGNTITGTTEENTDGDSSSLIYRFNKTFDGTAGNGLVGAITIQDMYFTTGFFISDVKILSTGLAHGVASYITLGIETDDVDSGLDITSGDAATLAGTPIFVLNTLPFTQATDLRKLVMAANTTDVTAGTITLIVTLTKL